MDRENVILLHAARRLPRYTSYPTAPHFGSDVTAKTYEKWLGAVTAGSLGSLYLHVPYCRAMCWYCGCHTQATLRAAPIERYLDALEWEIDRVAAALPIRLQIEQVHWGGGSPTLVPPERFLAIMQRLRARFDVLPKAELALEVDPRTTSERFVEAVGAAGMTRASIGVQTCDARVQAAVNRVQSWHLTCETARRLRLAGIERLNVDLLCGLPLQTVASCRETVAKISELLPDRVSVFGYAHVPHLKKHQRMIRREELPGPAERLAQADAIAADLKTAGYLPVGLDHFARPDDPLAHAFHAGTLRRNFQGYTIDRADILIGLGASAISRLAQGYAQNDAATERWRARILGGGLATARGLRLQADDRMRAAVIERLMCFLEADVEAIAADHGLPPPTVDLGELERQGIVRQQAGRVTVVPAFRPLVRAVAAAFDARLGSSATRHAVAV